MLSWDYKSRNPKYKPSNFEKSILSWGLNFIPTPNASSKKNLLKEFDDFANNLRKRKAFIHFRNDPIVNQSNIPLALHAIKKPQGSKIYDVFPQYSAIKYIYWYFHQLYLKIIGQTSATDYEKIPKLHKGQQSSLGFTKVW